VRDVLALLKAIMTGNACERARREMRLAYLVGYVIGRGLFRRPAYTPQGLPSAPDVPVSTAASVAVTHLL